MCVCLVHLSPWATFNACAYHKFRACHHMRCNTYIMPVLYVIIMECMNVAATCLILFLVLFYARNSQFPVVVSVSLGHVIAMPQHWVSVLSVQLVCWLTTVQHHHHHQQQHQQHHQHLSIQHSAFSIHVDDSGPVWRRQHIYILHDSQQLPMIGVVEFYISFASHHHTNVHHTNMVIKIVYCRCRRCLAIPCAVATAAGTARDCLQI